MSYSFVEMAKIIAVGDKAIDTGGTVQVWFANGLALSIAYHDGAYADEGTCELAVLSGTPENYGIRYSRANGWSDVRPYQTAYEALGAAAALAQASPSEFSPNMPSMVD